MSKYSILTKEIEQLNETEKIALWNEYCDGNNCNRFIYHCDKSNINLLFGERTAYEILSGLENGFKMSYTYMSLNAYGVYESFNDADYIIEVSDIVNWLCDCNAICKTINISEIMEKYGLNEDGEPLDEDGEPLDEDGE